MIKHKLVSPPIGTVRCGRTFAWFPKSFLYANPRDMGLVQTTIWLDYYNYKETWLGFDRGGWERTYILPDRTETRAPHDRHDNGDI